MKRRVIFYKTKDNKCNVIDFLDGLSGTVAKKVVWVLKLLEELDKIPVSYFKKLAGTEEIWECRIKSGSNSYRILGFFIDGSIIILTNGFKKKTRKIPKVQIEIAESFRNDYMKRKNNE